MKEYTNVNLTSDFVARNHVLMLPTEYMFLEQA
jgi:hypothetical protein